jgi:UDP-glucose 4-epimerase
MKILVTGGAGFIGSHVVDAFLNAGHDVAVLDSLETGSSDNLNKAALFFEADIRDSERLNTIFKQFRPDVVSHHAAQISVPHSVDDPAFDASINVVGSLNVWRAAREAGASRFIFASSGGAVYGDANIVPTPETFAPKPLSPYGLSKQVFEMYLEQLGGLGDMVPVILRYANVYGPRQGAGGEAGVISVFVKRLMNNQLCTIFGDGTMTRDYVYVGDVAQANLIALAQGDNQVFNIASTTQTTTLELFRMISTILECDPENVRFAPERKGEVRYSCLESNKAHSVLGWHPQTKLNIGLKNVIAYEKIQS